MRSSRLSRIRSSGSFTAISSSADAISSAYPPASPRPNPLNPSYPTNRTAGRSKHARAAGGDASATDALAFFWWRCCGARRTFCCVKHLAHPGQWAVWALLETHVLQLVRLFYFYIFRKHFFTEIYFQYHNLQFCTPTARQGLICKFKKIYLRGSSWREPAAPCRAAGPLPPLHWAAGGRQAPPQNCCAIRCVLDMDTNKNH